ncbi:choline-binding surface protein A [Streptococcus pneumoniae]|nr:choline-binding surface protein A [Streptococcus pneumoniae]
MFASKNERKVHYSIRKFSIGVASVAVASLFMGSVVHATEKEVTTQVATSSNKANKSQTEHMKAAKQVDEYIEKMFISFYIFSLTLLYHFNMNCI